MSFFKRLFGIKDPATAEEEQPAVFAEEAPVEAVPVAETVVEEPLDHFAVIMTPAPPVFEEEPLAEPQPTVESPAIVVEDEPVAETASPPEPDTPIEVGRMTEADVLEALENALDELGSAHHRPFSRG